MSDEDKDFEVRFCPFCGADFEHLSYTQRFDVLWRRFVVDGFCDYCKRMFFVVFIDNDSHEEGEMKHYD